MRLPLPLTCPVPIACCPLRSTLHGALYGFTLSANARVVSHLGAEDVYSAHITTTLALALAYAVGIIMAAVILILGGSLGMPPHPPPYDVHSLSPQKKRTFEGRV
jgi:hypothetical protein